MAARGQGLQLGHRFIPALSSFSDELLRLNQKITLVPLTAEFLAVVEGDTPRLWKVAEEAAVHAAEVWAKRNSAAIFQIGLRHEADDLGGPLVRAQARLCVLPNREDTRIVQKEFDRIRGLVPRVVRHDGNDS